MNVELAGKRAGLDDYTETWVLCSKIYTCAFPEEPILCDEEPIPAADCIEQSAYQGHYFLSAVAGGPNALPCNQVITNPN